VNSAQCGYPEGAIPSGGFPSFFLIEKEKEMDANEHTQFYLDQLKPLVGGVIEDAVRTEGDEFGDEFFGLAIRCKDGEVRHLIILADDEGNGPGSFEIVVGESHG
jgi:hypothetical protein